MRKSSRLWVALAATGLLAVAPSLGRDVAMQRSVTPTGKKAR